MYASYTVVYVASISIPPLSCDKYDIVDNQFEFRCVIDVNNWKQNVNHERIFLNGANELTTVWQLKR